MEILNTTEVALGLFTTDEADIFGMDNVSITPTGSSDVVSGSGLSADAWLKKVSLISTPILMVLGLCGNTLALMVTSCHLTYIRLVILANSAKPDQMQQNVVSDWVLHCLLTRCLAIVSILVLTYIAGLCGNLLTLMVTASRAYRRTAHGVYITAMAIADITFLLTQPLNRGFIHDIFGWDIRTHSAIGCKVYFFFLRWSRPMSSLVIVLICIERFVAIWLPLRAKIFSSRRIALLQVCGIFSLACFVSGFRVQTVGIKNDLCIGIVSTPDNKQLKTLCSFMGLTIRTLVPTITLLVLTPPTVAKLFYQRRLRLAMSQGKSNQSDETFRVSLMLLSVAVAFCVLVTPFCLSKHWYLLSGTKVYLSSATWMKSLSEIRQICEQLNCVINFFLYVLISREFRNQFRDILTCRDERKPVRGSARINSSGEKQSIRTASSSNSKG